nr:class I SAM-dependent methyltransferase [Planctomycetota bacterium]
DAPERQVLAIDHSEERMQALRESAHALPIEVRTESMEGLTFPRCSGVALVDVMHYLPEESQHDLLARCAHALEPGGVIVLRDPDASGGWRFRLTRLHERIATRFGWTQASLGHFRSVRGWAAQLEEQGLEARILPRRLLTPYADRTVIGYRP